MASSDTLNQRWANDKSKFGYQMLLKMGWTEGRGAGKNEDGISSHIKVKKRADRAALGAEDDSSGNSAFINQIDNFSAVLANLNASHGSSRKRARASDDETDSRGTDSDADSATGEASEPRKKDKAVGRKKRKADKADDKADKKKKKKAKKEKKEKKAKKEKKVKGLTAERKVHARAVRDKNVSNYSQADLNAILGVASTVRTTYEEIRARNA